MKRFPKQMSAEVSNTLLSINKVSIGSKADGTIVKDLTLTLKRGQRLGLVGESGSGKTLSALSIAGLIPGNLNVQSGEIFVYSKHKKYSFPGASPRDVLSLRRKVIGFVFQEPMSALNPVRTCGWQLMENLRLGGKSKNEKAEALRWMEKVELPSPEDMFHRYPHQLSGGQRQRLMIAMALANDPELLIADEPTTALDVRVRDIIMDLMEKLCMQNNTTLLLISHDLHMVARRCDQIAILRNGECLEFGSTSSIVENPKTAYTKALWACRPNPSRRMYPLPTVEEFERTDDATGTIYNEDVWREKAAELRKNTPLLKGINLLFSYGNNPIINNLSFELFPGETVGILGPSGCGKSTLSRIIAGLERLSSGDLHFFRNDAWISLEAMNRSWRGKHIQMIFQDAMAALNPYQSIGTTLTEVRKHFFPKERPEDRKKTVENMLHTMALPLNGFHRYPHTFSGGQRQRICIARALLAEPKILLCDESIAALDVSVQAQILNMLDQLRREKNMSILFISHDPETVRYFCHRVLEMENGSFIQAS